MEESDKGDLNMEESDKDLNSDRLIALLGEIGQEVNRSPIDPVKLSKLLGILYIEIIRLPVDSGRVLEILTEVYYSALRVLAEWSVKNTNKDREDLLNCALPCIDENTFSWPNALSLFDLTNPTLNRAVGLTHRSGVGTPPHPTSWQHKLAMNHFPEYDKIGKYSGRAALLSTLYEGGYDIFVMLNCVGVCKRDKDDPCDRLSDNSCGLLPDIYGMMP